MATRAEFIERRFRQVLSQVMDGCITGMVTTAFTVYRRKRVGSGDRNALGIQVRPEAQDFTLIGSGQGAYSGTGLSSPDWVVQPTGQLQIEELELFTEFRLLPGDNVRLAVDGRVYLVEAVAPVGPVVRCRLNNAKAQVI